MSENVDLVEIAIRMLALGLPHLGGFLGLGGQTPPGIRELPPVSTRLDRAQVVTGKFPTPGNRKWVILGAPQNFWGPLAPKKNYRFRQCSACGFYSTGSTFLAIFAKIVIWEHVKNRPESFPIGAAMCEKRRKRTRLIKSSTLGVYGVEPPDSGAQRPSPPDRPGGDTDAIHAVSRTFDVETILLPV